MANHKSALKRARQNETRNTRNRAARSVVRALAKDVEVAVGKGDAETATKSLKTAQRAIAKAAAHKIVHWRTAARKTSRLAKAVKKVAIAKKA